MAKRACLFVRVSSKDDRQDYQRQIDDLKKYCERQGLEIIKIIAEKISGAKKNDEREGIKELRTIAGKNFFDVLVVSEISRLGRNPFQIQQVIEELSIKGISIHVESLGLKTIDENDNRSPLVDFMLAILMQLSRIEREFLIQRVKSGLTRARAIGKTLGRPQGSILDEKSLLKKYKPLSADLINGLSVRKAAKIHDCSLNTVLKVKKALLLKVV
jgi:DNA invertase Pin-like site-specific DNA recombinase